jgi:HSP20 family protein
MKKLIIAAILSMILAGSALAVSTPTEQDYQNLDQTREKLIRMRREMDRFMKDLVGPYADMDKNGVFGQDVRVDVTDNGKDIVVKADLPGMTKDQIDITLERNSLLKISGSREVMTRQESQGVVKQERMSGRFERSLELPAECESGGIRATYKEGVLEIMLPKKKNVKEEAIKVNVQ